MRVSVPPCHEGCPVAAAPAAVCSDLGPKGTSGNLAPPSAPDPLPVAPGLRVPLDVECSSQEALLVVTHLAPPHQYDQVFGAAGGGGHSVSLHSVLVLYNFDCFCLSVRYIWNM